MRIYITTLKEVINRYWLRSRRKSSYHDRSWPWRACL